MKKTIQTVLFLFIGITFAITSCKKHNNDVFPNADTTVIINTPFVDDSVSIDTLIMPIDTLLEDSTDEDSTDTDTDLGGKSAPKFVYLNVKAINGFPNGTIKYPNGTTTPKYAVTLAIKEGANVTFPATNSGAFFIAQNGFTRYVFSTNTKFKFNQTRLVKLKINSIYSLIKVDFHGNANSFITTINTSEANTTANGSKLFLPNFQFESIAL